MPEGEKREVEEGERGKAGAEGKGKEWRDGEGGNESPAWLFQNLGSTAVHRL